ncbi:MAG: hypothetical protein Q9161_007464 [Pseudevernia consocians]
MSSEDLPSAPNFYSPKTVFLTGGTGGLGGCLLHKLLHSLPTQKVYALVRESPATAISKWRRTMSPEITDRMLATDRLVLMVGDMTKPQFGIDDGTFAELVEKVQIVIHAAANISFKAPLQKVVADNCISSLELARLATSFKKLESYVQVSSAYANTFLPDGLVSEKIYELGDPEAELLEIQATGTTKYLKDFAWPYAYSKHLMERLLVKRYPELPLTIVRPTSIGPAIKEPFAFYGPEGSIPIDTVYSRMMWPVGGLDVYHAAQGSTSGSNILDEVPVDVVANLTLLHLMLGTRDVAQVGSLCYTPRAFDKVIADVRRSLPPSWLPKIPTAVFTTDRSKKQGQLAQFYRIATTDWTFDNGKSRALLGLEGVLSVKFEGHDVDDFTEKRIQRIFERTKPMMEAMEKKAGEKRVDRDVEGRVKAARARL